ncbi:DNA polymerase III subunit chi, partial [Oceanicola granulosus HTCC2516]
MMLTRIPGGRHLSVPTISSTAAAMEAISMNDSPSSQ